MANLPTPKELGKKICMALGLDADKVASISFSWTPESIGKISVTQYVTLNDMVRMETVLREYQLVSTDEVTDSV